MNPENEAGTGGTFLTRFLWTFYAPKNLYADIAAERAHWWQPWVWVSIINGIIAYFSIPIQIHLARLNPQDVPEEQLQQSLEMMEKFGFLGVISTPVVVLVTSLIIVGISYLVVSVMAEEARFKKYFTLYLYSSIVVSVGILLGTLITRMKGLDNVRSVADASASFGPAVLVSFDQKILHAILSSFDVFYVWFYALMAIGVSYIFKMSSRAAMVVVVPIWLLFVLIALVSARVSA